jgi:hypothetical protein
MTSINAAFPVCVLNFHPPTLKDLAWQALTLTRTAGLSLVIERWALARTLGDLVLRKV